MKSQGLMKVRLTISRQYLLQILFAIIQLQRSLVSPGIDWHKGEQIVTFNYRKFQQFVDNKN